MHERGNQLGSALASVRHESMRYPRDDDVIFPDPRAPLIHVRMHANTKFSTIRATRVKRKRMERIPRSPLLPFQPPRRARVVDNKKF